MDMITIEEREQILERLNGLRAKRGEITTRIEEARALGDLKENAEYHAAREDQGMNEAEIKRLEDRIANARVVDTSTVPDDMVFIGATVRLKDLKFNDEELFKLVGEASGNVPEDVTEVSTNSPMGESLLKARVGDVVRVDAPRGEIRFEVMEIL
jgi:transcription elongation factor GreA